tara:strand:- start:975 stop:2255 length:1281 start_codon:yes stop_codon:yes gene_type:complete
MAELTYTVTVASGSLYGGGTGSVFYLDGARNSTGPGTVSWVNGGTLRFDQSAGSNDNHPLVFSTTTGTGGIISSGITYYLDGASNQAGYTNTTTFNAATTRYVEVTPSSETDFYYLCYVHGIGMGGIMDITQKTWGAMSWGTGVWSDQSSMTAAVTGSALTLSQGSAEGVSINGWGRAEWGSGAWGITGSVLVGSQSLASSLGSVTVEALVEVGWGRGGWGNRAWGETYSVLPAGQQATLSQGSVTPVVDHTVQVSGLDLLTITQGVNSIQIDNNVTVFVGEPALQTSIGTLASITGDGFTGVLSGQSVTSSVGQVIPAPKIEVGVTGISMSLTLGTFTLVQTTVESVTTAGLLSSSIGSVTPISVYDVTGQALASSVGSVSITGGAVVDVSGIGLTANIGSVNVTAWSEIDPGVNNVWTEVDRAA